MLKRCDKVYINTKTKNLLDEIARKLKLDSAVNPDLYYSYDTLNASGSHHHQKIFSVFVREENKIHNWYV